MRKITKWTGKEPALVTNLVRMMYISRNRKFLQTFSLIARIAYLD